MKFKSVIRKPYFRQTLVDNAFIDQVLPNLVGDEIKVYLYCLRGAQQYSEFSIPEIASRLKLTVSTVEKVLVTLTKYQLIEWDRGDNIMVFSLYDDDGSDRHKAAFELYMERIYDFINNKVPHQFTPGDIHHIENALKNGIPVDGVLAVLRYNYIDKEQMHFDQTREMLYELDRSGKRDLASIIDYIKFEWEDRRLYRVIHEKILGPRIEMTTAHISRIKKWIEVVGKDRIIDEVSDIVLSAYKPTYNYVGKSIFDNYGVMDSELQKKPSQDTQNNTANVIATKKRASRKAKEMPSVAAATEDEIMSMIMAREENLDK